MRTVLTFFAVAQEDLLLLFQVIVFLFFLIVYAEVKMANWCPDGWGWQTHPSGHL